MIWEGLHEGLLSVILLLPQTSGVEMYHDDAMGMTKSDSDYIDLIPSFAFRLSTSIHSKALAGESSLQ